jgi:arylformamidase
MALHDISVAIRNHMPVYPGDPAVEVDTPVSLANGASANVSRLRMGAHTGTHVDAPAHFLAGGSGAADLPLDALIGDAYVIEVPHTVHAITPEHVTSAIAAQCERVLFKTRGSSFWGEERFREDFTFLAADTAHALVAAGVRLIGIDYLSIEMFKSPTHETHRVLLEADVVILEGLDLTGIDPGVYELLCLPLKVADGAGDGAPARAVLRDCSPRSGQTRRS